MFANSELFPFITSVSGLSRSSGRTIVGGASTVLFSKPESKQE